MRKLSVLARCWVAWWAVSALGIRSSREVRGTVDPKRRRARPPTMAYLMWFTPRARQSERHSVRRTRSSCSGLLAGAGGGGLTVGVPPDVVGRGPLELARTGCGRGALDTARRETGSPEVLGVALLVFLSILLRDK